MFLRALRLFRVSLDLCLTYRPGTGRFKIFAEPDHRGGPKTKHAQLGGKAAKRGEPWSTLICLSSVRVPLSVLRYLRKKGARIVVNQNGVYYPLWCPVDFEKRNRFLAGLNRVSHHSFFQSEFSEISYRDWVGELPPSRSVLYNAVDRSVFRPAPARAPDSRRLRVLIFLDFRASTRDLWEHLLPLLRDGSRGYVWVLLGWGEDEALVARLKNELKDSAEWNLNYDQSRVAETLRGCDAALHLVYNDVCPNKVLECLASGVYVICSSAGGTRELVSAGGGEVLEVEGGYEKRSYPPVAEIAGALERFRARAADFKAEAARASERFDLTEWIRVMTGEGR